MKERERERIRLVCVGHLLFVILNDDGFDAYTHTHTHEFICVAIGEYQKRRKKKRGDI